MPIAKQALTLKWTRDKSNKNLKLSRKMGMSIIKKSNISIFSDKQLPNHMSKNLPLVSHQLGPHNRVGSNSWIKSHHF